MSEPQGGGIDTRQALSNILIMLQEDPRRHRLFGVWWWQVKVMLRAAGNTRDNLYLLGDYLDREQMALTPLAGAEESLRQALAEYGENARFGRPNGLVEGPDGELLAIVDQDAGGI